MRRSFASRGTDPRRSPSRTRFMFARASATNRARSSKVTAGSRSGERPPWAATYYRCDVGADGDMKTRPRRPSLRNGVMATENRTGFGESLHERGPKPTKSCAWSRRAKVSLNTLTPSVSDSKVNFRAYSCRMGVHNNCNIVPLTGSETNWLSSISGILACFRGLKALTETQ
jgi:hypothetical protein